MNGRNGMTKKIYSYGFLVPAGIIYFLVFLKPMVKDGSEKKVLKLSKPINCQSVRVHLVKLKKKDIAVGSKNTKKYIIPAGTKKP